VVPSLQKLPWAESYAPFTWPATAKGSEEAYRQATRALDPIRYVSHAAPAALLFQFSNTDIYIAKARAMGIFRGASAILTSDL
jgi:hypothetical protein